MTAGIDHYFQKTKAQLFRMKSAGFLGPLLCKLSFSWDASIDTACVNTKEMRWNPDFFMNLTEAQRVTVLAHELWHIGFMHLLRLGTRDAKLWNIAGDHVINLRLKDDGYDMSDFPYLMDSRFNGLSTDQVYDILEKEASASPAGSSGTPSADGLGYDIEHKPMTDAEKYDAITDVVAATQAAKIGGKPGDVPGETTLLINEFLDPKLPWETLLYNFFNALTNKDRSFARPSRRYDDPYMPGMSPSNGLEHLIYYLDISGSVTDDQIRVFNSEVKFIQEELRPERLTLVTFDTKIHDVYEFEIDEPFYEIHVTGRGGTSLNKVYKHMKKHQPTAAVIFTDLWVHIPENPGIPLVWCCTDNPGGKVPYGTLIHVDTTEYGK